MKRSLTALLLVALGALLTLTIHAQAQRRSRNRTDNNGGGYGQAAPAPVVAASMPGTGPAATGTAPASPAAPGALMAAPPMRFSGRAADPLPSDFVILERKSIFNKDRRLWRPPTPNYDRPPRVDTPRRPAIPVLVGVLLGDDGYVAYVEDPDTAKLWPFAAGDQISDYGYVVEVNMDGMEIAKEGGVPVQIAVGKDLKGQTPDMPVYSSPAPSASATSSTPASTAPGATTGPAGPVDTSNMSIEERMKLRRQQQLNP